MLEKKGDLMSYRPDIKLLDATIRDGGLVNNFRFLCAYVSPGNVGGDQWNPEPKAGSGGGIV